MSRKKRNFSSPERDRSDPLESLAMLATATTYKQPIGGRGTKPGRTPQDIAGALSMGTQRMDCGQAWSNIAILIASFRPVTSETVGDLVDAVVDDVQGRIKTRVAKRVHRRVLYAVLFGEIANATQPRENRTQRRNQMTSSPIRRGWNPEYLSSTAERAKAARMRLIDFSALEREVRAVVEDRIRAAAAGCGPT